MRIRDTTVIKERATVTHPHQLTPPPADAPRDWHEWYAHACGYFWQPCPTCGAPFGGHERVGEGKYLASIPERSGDPRLHEVICPPCTRAGLGTPWPASADNTASDTPT